MLLPVRITAEPALAEPAPSPASPAPSAQMTIVLANGCRIEVDRGVDEAALRRVLSALGNAA